MGYKTIKDIIDSSIQDTTSNDSKADLYYNEFIFELEEYLNKIDVDLVRIMTMNEKRSGVKKLYKQIRAIKGLAGFFSEELIEQLFFEVEKIVKEMKFDRVMIDKENLSFVFKTNDLIRKLIENHRCSYKEFVYDEIQNHVEKMKKFNEEINL